MEEKTSHAAHPHDPTDLEATRAHSETTMTERPDGHGRDEETSTQQVVADKVADQPPNGGYGWVCVVCVALINMHTWGLNSSYGVFLSYFGRNDTFPGYGVLDYAFVGGLSISVAFLLAPIATVCIRKYGTQVTLFIGVFFETLALITASFSTEIWHLFLSQGVCFGIGLGFLYTASVGIVAQWFTTRRSFANACAAGGSGLGGLAYNLASQAVIARADWRWAYRMIGICAFTVNLICAILVRDRNKAVGAKFKLFDYKLFRRKEFNLVQAWGFLNMLGYFVLIYSLPSYATSIGLSPSQGSIVGAILNLGQAIGRPVVGIFSDRVGRINIAAGLSALCGFLCLVWWIFAHSFGTLVSFALVMGTIAGTYWATIAPVGAEVVGLADLPSALSMTWLCLILPVTFSEAIALEIETNTSYLYAQLYTGLVYLASAGCLWYVRAWKIGQLEELAAAEGKPLRDIRAVQTETPAQQGVEVERYPKSSLVKRFWMWKAV